MLVGESRLILIVLFLIFILFIRIFGIIRLGLCISRRRFFGIRFCHRFCDWLRHGFIRIHHRWNIRRRLCRRFVRIDHRRHLCIRLCGRIHHRRHLCGGLTDPRFCSRFAAAGTWLCGRLAAWLRTGRICGRLRAAGFRLCGRFTSSGIWLRGRFAADRFLCGCFCLCCCR